MKTLRRFLNALTLIVVAMTVMAADPLAQPPKPPLSVTNASMEEVAVNAKAPTGYVIWGTPGGLIQSDPTVAFEGKRSVKLTLKGESETFGVYQSVASTAPEGAKCRFRARVRTQDLDGQAYLMIYVYSTRPLGEPYFSATRISGTQDWTTVEAVVPAHKEGKLFQVFMLVTGTWGRVWWDNLEASVEEKP
jgi:hypothetical protein